MMALPTLHSKNLPTNNTKRTIVSGSSSRKPPTITAGMAAGLKRKPPVLRANQISGTRSKAEGFKRFTNQERRVIKKHRQKKKENIWIDSKEDVIPKPALRSDIITSLQKRSDIIASLHKEILSSSNISKTVGDYLKNYGDSNFDDLPIKDVKVDKNESRRHTAPEAPVSPSRPQIVAMPLPPPISPRYESVLPDPMEEYIIREYQYKENQKNIHGANTLKNIINMYNAHCVKIAFSRWIKDTKRKRDYAFKCQYASKIIGIAWKNYFNLKLISKYNNANNVFKRNLFKMIITLKVLKRRKNAKLLTKFVKQTVGPRFKTVIQTLRWKVIKCQRNIRDYLICSNARLKLLRLKFEKRVKMRCEEIRNVHTGRSKEYQDLKAHLRLEQLRSVEEKWHDAHARTKAVMQIALTAASRAKRRRMRFKKQMREGEAAAALQQAKIDAILQQVNENKMNDEMNKKKERMMKRKINKNKSILANKENQQQNVKNEIKKCMKRNLMVTSKHKNMMREAITKEKNVAADIANNDQFDALALQYMHLPSGIRLNLLRKILKNSRKNWIIQQDEEKRLYENQVEIHRPISEKDVKKMLKGDLHASELEKETIVRWQRKPLQLWSTDVVTKDLDVAIDIAITKCVWDC